MDKELYELIYDRLPEVYRREDAEVPIHPYPLKRFFKIAFEGVKPIEKKIDNINNLFDAYKTDAKNLDTLAELLGFYFPEGTLEEEKRRIIKNLPELYKIKGSNTVYEVLAKLVFHKDVETNIEWSYPGFTKASIVLDVVGYIPDLSGKQSRFLELIEHFRTPNTKIGWLLAYLYLETVITSTREENDRTVLKYNDNYDSKGKDFPVDVDLTIDEMAKLIITTNYVTDTYDELYGKLNHTLLNEGVYVPELVDVVEVDSSSTMEKVRFNNEDVEITTAKSVHIDTLEVNSIDLNQLIQIIDKATYSYTSELEISNVDVIKTEYVGVYPNDNYSNLGEDFKLNSDFTFANPSVLSNSERVNLSEMINTEVIEWMEDKVVPI